MGAIADGIMAFAQPLIDQAESKEDLDKALAISQLCFNLALLSDEQRDTLLAETRQSLGMDDQEFDEFRRSIIDPMIQRHHEMFPLMHQRRSLGRSPLDFGLSPSPAPLRPAQASPEKAARAGKYPGTGPYEPCPCNSGEKYKFCCAKKGR
jgi:hypothetical protein